MHSIQTLQEVQSRHSAQLDQVLENSWEDSIEDQEKWTKWETWARNIHSAMGQLFTERHPVFATLSGLHSNVDQLGKGVQLASSVLQSWEPVLQHLNNRCMQLDSLQGGLDFLKEQVRIACTSAQNSASSSQFDFLKCQLDKHQNTIQTWHDFLGQRARKEFPAFPTNCLFGWKNECSGQPF